MTVKRLMIFSGVVVFLQMGLILKNESKAMMKDEEDISLYTISKMSKLEGHMGFFEKKSYTLKDIEELDKDIANFNLRDPHPNHTVSTVNSKLQQIIKKGQYSCPDSHAKSVLEALEFMIQHLTTIEKSNFQTKVFFKEFMDRLMNSLYY